jgi:hypothetical protein
MAGKAGALYALIGTLRVPLLAPRLGQTTAVILETPVMLIASWFVCRWCVDRVDVPRTVPVRSVMGVVAFAVLMAAEFGLALLLFGRSTAEYDASSRWWSGAMRIIVERREEKRPNPGTAFRHTKEYL